LALAMIHALSGIVRASMCARCISSKALSNSSGPRTGKRCSCNLSGWATFSIACQSAVTGLSGFTRAATRVSCGMASLSNSTLFPLISGLKKLDPVMLPPGRAKLATIAPGDWVSDDRHHNGNGRGRPLGSSGCGCSMSDDHIHARANQLVRKRGEPRVVLLRPAVFDNKVCALDIGEVAQTRA